MQKEVTVPDIGDYKDVEIIEILVSPGDKIAKEDPLITLETDKATMEIPSTLAGEIKELLVKVGDRVSEGSVIAKIEAIDSDENLESKLATKESEESKSKEDKEIKSEEREKNKEIEESSKKLDKSTEKFVEEIIIPDLGTDSEVEVIEVSVSIGDKVEKDQTLLTLESDKASMDIPAPYSGKINEFSVKVGNKVKSGDKIGLIETQVSETTEKVEKQIDKEEKSKEFEEKPKQESKAKEQALLKKQEEKTTTVSFSAKVHASPSVRRYARELGVDLAGVKGSGKKERILKEDVNSYVKRVVQEKSQSQAVGSTAGIEIAPMPKIDHSKFGEIEEQALSRIKKLSGSYLHRNWVRVPHVTQFDEADITELEEFRSKQKSLAEKQGVKLTPLAFLMKAAVAGLKEFPIFNSSLDETGEKIILKKYYHIGVAVDTPNGLVVPVVRDVDKKGLFQLAQELGEISAKARDGKLTANDMQGSCFSISSLGGIGGTAFTPIVNVPDVAILGVSKSSIKPVYTDGEFKPRLMLPLSLSYDHRVIDGADGARFTRFLVHQLSDIRRLLL